MPELLDLADVEARIERHRCHVNAPRPTEAGAADLSRLIDHDAPALLAAIRALQEGIRQLRGQSEHMTRMWEQTSSAVKRVEALHCEYRIYDECGHHHTEVDDYVRDVSYIGLVCEEGYQYSICRHCCTDACGDQTEECIATHTHAGSLCPTRDALNVSSEAARTGLHAAFERLIDAAEDVLAEAEQAETDAVFSGAADPARLGTPALKALREAVLAMPALDLDGAAS